jgi:hypothetical protein
MTSIKEMLMMASYDDAGDRVCHSKRPVRRPVGPRLGSVHPGPKHRSRSTQRGENEIRQGDVPMKVSRAPGVSDFLDGDGMNKATDLNLVPLDNLPRRVRHKNERTCRSRTSSDVRS